MSAPEPAKKPPSHSCPRYVVARVRTLLAAKGWPIHVVKGRYSAFSSTQHAAEGFSVSKVGCSKEVAIHYSGRLSEGRSHPLPRDISRARIAEAIEYLRSLGYRVDDKGWIKCDQYDDYDR